MATFNRYLRMPQLNDPSGDGSDEDTPDPYAYIPSGGQVPQGQSGSSVQPGVGGTFGNLLGLPGDIVNNLSARLREAPEIIRQRHEDAAAHSRALAAYRSHLPADQLDAFDADPAGWMAKTYGNMGHHSVAGGATDYTTDVYGNRVQNTADLMTVQNGTPITQTPTSTTVTGQRLPGDTFFHDGLIGNTHDPVPNGSYSSAVKGPDDQVFNFTPSFNARPTAPVGQSAPTAPTGPPGGMPQVGAPGPSQPAPAAFAGPSPAIPQRGAGGPPPPPAPPTARDVLPAIQANPQAFFSRALGVPVTITSGQRSAAHNRAVGGSPTSEHLTNAAWDIQAQGMTSTQVAQKLASLGLPFDQVIDEGSHAHIGFGPKTRGAVMAGGPGNYRTLGTRNPMPQRGGAPAAPGPVTPMPANVTAPDGTVSSQGSMTALTGPRTPAMVRTATAAEIRAAGLPAGTAAQIKPNGEIVPFAAGLQQNGGSAATPNPGGLTGAAFLNMLPPEERALVRAYSEGRAPIPTGAALRNPIMAKAFADVAQYDPTFDAANYTTRVKTRSNFTTGAQGQNITSINTALDHAAALYDQIDKLGNNSLPVVGGLINSVHNSLADPGSGEVTRFNAQRTALATELARTFQGGAPHQAEISHFLDLLSPTASPEQLRGALKGIGDLLAGRVNELGNSYNSGMGRSIDGLALLHPEAAGTLANLTGGDRHMAVRKSAFYQQAERNGMSPPEIEAAWQQEMNGGFGSGGSARTASPSANSGQGWRVIAVH